MKKNSENRRNTLMENLRNELIRKSSLINQSSSNFDENFEASMTKFPPINPNKLPLVKPGASIRLNNSFSLNRRSLQLSHSISTDGLTALDFDRNLKNLIGAKNLRKVRELFLSRELTIRSSIHDQSKSELFASLTLQRLIHKTLRERFRKAVRLLLNIIKLISIHKVSKEKIKQFGKAIKMIDLDRHSNEDIFDPTFYARPKEPTFSDEAKKMLNLPPNERTDNMLRYIMISLNFSVPEFSELPIHIQRMWARRAYYQEFETDRVIVRQGHYATYYYMIVSGKAIVIEASASWPLPSTDPEESNAGGGDNLVYTPLRVIKRGECFGEVAIMNNSKRTSSIKVSGSKPMGVLVVDKEDFFLIQGSRSSKDKLKFLKTSVPLLNQAEYPFDALERESKRSIQVCFSFYYRNGAVISANSQEDDWIYIVKSGSCKLIKRIRVDAEVVNAYWEQMAMSNRERQLRRIEYLLDMDTHSSYVREDELMLGNRTVRLGEERDGLREVFLELPKLSVGQIFGLNDVIFDRELDQYTSSFMLVSEGAECVLISRRYFQKHLHPHTWFKLRVSSPIYPNDDYFVDKYFNSFIWKDFKQKTVQKVVDDHVKVKLKDTMRTYDS